MLANVKFSLSKNVKAVDSKRPGGVTVSSVATNLEGFFTDTRGKDIKFIQGVPTMTDRPVTFKVIFERREVWDASQGTKFWSNLENVEDGYYLDVTHYKHPVTKSWVPYSAGQVVRYQISYIQKLDPLGNIYELSLKDRDK